MLKLVKNTSNENYPITPQTSAVRKLTVRGTVNTGADLFNSYLVVKNGLQTTASGAAAVRNVSWGQAMAQDNIYEYPASCQIKYATLKVAGQVVEYNEDVNVRVVNMDVYSKNHEARRKYANTGSCGFQRLEAGPKVREPDVATNVRSQGFYMSPFLNETVTTVGAPVTRYKKTGCTYKEVSSIIYLGDIFQFCNSTDAKEVYMGGKEITVELQFENYNQILAEVVNYPTDLTSDPVPRPFINSTLAVTPATVSKVEAPAAVVNPNAGDLIDQVYFISTVSSYEHVNEVPLYVGQPICLWLAGGALPATGLPAVVGSNYANVVSVSVPVGGGIASIGFKAYTQNGLFLRAGGANITAAQFQANFFAGGNGVCVAISGVNDPILAAGAPSVLTDFDAGKRSTYSVNGLDLVVVEKPMMSAQKNTINFIQYMRDTDAIAQGQLSYTKSFRLDPNCVAVHCMFPPKFTAASGQTNILSLNRHQQPLPANTANIVSNGLSYRCLINGQQLYSRDIAFGASDSVEPLYYHRLTLAAMNEGMMLNNLSPKASFVATNAGTCHAMISEPVPQSEQEQQLSVSLTFTANASDRTIYVYKAIKKQLSF
jgi:hypothetical protein